MAFAPAVDLLPACFLALLSASCSAVTVLSVRVEEHSTHQAMSGLAASPAGRALLKFNAYIWWEQRGSEANTSFSLQGSWHEVITSAPLGPGQGLRLPRLPQFLRSLCLWVSESMLLSATPRCLAAPVAQGEMLGLLPGPDKGPFFTENSGGSHGGAAGPLPSPTAALHT